MMKNKMYSIGILKAEPLNRLPEIGDVVQWINTLEESFYAIVVSVTEACAEFRNYYPTDDRYYCFSNDLLTNLIALELYLCKDNVKIGTVSKNVVDAFLSKQIALNDSVWYELKDSAPRIHKKNLICKV